MRNRFRSSVSQVVVSVAVMFTVAVAATGDAHAASPLGRGLKLDETARAEFLAASKKCSDTYSPEHCHAAIAIGLDGGGTPGEVIALQAIVADEKSSRETERQLASEAAAADLQRREEAAAIDLRRREVERATFTPGYSIWVVDTSLAAAWYGPGLWSDYGRPIAALRVCRKNRDEAVTGLGRLSWDALALAAKFGYVSRQTAYGQGVRDTGRGCDFINWDDDRDGHSR